MKRCALRCFSTLFASIALAACGQPADVLAVFHGGSITTGDFDQYVASLPDSRRTIADGQSPEDWARSNLEQLAIERILGGSECAREAAASPEMEAFREWTRARLLAGKLTAQLDAAWQPNPDELAAEIERMQQQADIRTLYTFRHIYFRTDRASSSAEVEATRRRAQKVARLAQSGTDFEELVREHSDSLDAQDGGLVGNAPAAALDDTTAGILGSMSEGGISPVIETRTGLHIFRLERAVETEPMAEDRVAGTARTALRRRQVQQHLSALIDELRRRVTVEADVSGWRIGSWRVDRRVLEFVRAPSAGGADAVERHVEDQLLLAQEAIDRGLETPEIKDEIEETVRSTTLERCAAEVRREVISATPLEQLRELYDAQPSRFADLAKAHVELIFIPQGIDAFETQLRAEDLVARLRAGGSFADAAREHSTGPEAANGGDLGVLDLREWPAFGPPVFRAIRELEVGTISEPIYCTDKVPSNSSQLKGGFAIVRIRERVPESQRSFDTVIDEVRQAWAMKNRTLVTTLVEERILSDAGFEIVRLPSPDDL